LIADTHSHPPSFSTSTASPDGRINIRIVDQGRQEAKRCIAETTVAAPVDIVWKVLTEYERLPEFIPNLEECRRLSTSAPGRIRLLQRACSQAALWRLEASAILDIEEVKLPMGRREARFTMVKGDFKELNGRWIVQPNPSSSSGSRGQSCLLRYDISLSPRLSLPATIVSYIVKAGLPANINAVIRRAEQLARDRLKVSGPAAWAGVEEDPPIPGFSTNTNSMDDIGGMISFDDTSDMAVALPTKGPFWPAGFGVSASPFPTTRVEEIGGGGIDQSNNSMNNNGKYVVSSSSSQQQLKQRLRARTTSRKLQQQSQYLGVSSVPLPPAIPPEETLRTVLSSIVAEDALVGSYPEFSQETPQTSPSYTTTTANSNSNSNSNSYSYSDSDSDSDSTTEIHLRRLDRIGKLHRRAVASVVINAPINTIWNILTDYNNLAQYVPNLAASERMQLPLDAPERVVRVRQIGYKRMPYMYLHAETVLDLVETPCREIQFRQVSGSFDKFQGKWMLEEVETDDGDNDNTPPTPTKTLLKYAVEIVAPGQSRSILGIMEPILEALVFEDIPANMNAIKKTAEGRQLEQILSSLEGADDDDTKVTALKEKVLRPRASDMMNDFTILSKELARCFGGQKTLPSRKKLREMNRTDIEKAITAHGGRGTVAERLGWELQVPSRKPKGYWDSLPNVKLEIDEFINQNNLQSSVMPLKNDFVRAGRNDIARAIEKWGGLYVLASELGYETQDGSSRSGPTEWNQYISDVAANTGLSGREGLFQLAAESYQVDKNGKKQDIGKLNTVRREIDNW
jgi:ribosome-associated toxin RatA of RatAB toxin-antitoxin module